jgi:hypothetical protein
MVHTQIDCRSNGNCERRQRAPGGCFKANRDYKRPIETQSTFPAHHHNHPAAKFAFSLPSDANNQTRPTVAFGIVVSGRACESARRD